MSWSRRLNSPVNAEDHEYVVQVYRYTGVQEYYSFPHLSMLRTTSMLEEAMNPPVLAIISTLQMKFPAYHWQKKSYNKTFSKTQIAEKSLTKVKV